MRLELFIVAAVVLAAPAAAQDAARAPVNTLQEIGAALGACWRPPSGTWHYEVTVRLSFKRNGEVLGTPRITFSHFTGNVEEQKLIVGSILDALEECTPLNLTPGLGGAIAGRPFSLSFARPSTGI
jgi:hypothetical protein